MTEPEVSAPENRPHQWRRRLAWGAFALGALVIVFHRVILATFIHTAGVHWAAHRNVRLAFDIDGSIFTGITLQNVKASSIGNSPIDSISIESMRVHYDIARLFRRGLRDFISAYHLRNASLVLSPRHGTKEQEEEISRMLRNILQQPAFFSDRVQVENLTLVINTEHGPFALREVEALLDPVSPGMIRIGELEIPRIGLWKNIRTETSFVDRHLIARDFNLGKELHATRLELDASHRLQGIHYLSFEGTVFGGDAGLFLWRREIDKRSSDAQLTAWFGNVSLVQMHDFLRWKPTVSGVINKAWVQIGGNPNRPSQWQGDALVEAGGGAIQGFRINQLTGNLHLADGRFRLDHAEATTGTNRLTFDAEQRLPDSGSKLITSGLDAALHLDANDTSQIHAGFPSGRLHGSGRCQVNRSGVSIQLSSTASSITGHFGSATHPAFTVNDGDIDAHFFFAFRHRPKNTPWHDGMEVSIKSNARKLQSGPWLFDTASTEARLLRSKVEIQTSEWRRGRNTVRLNGTFELPPRATTTGSAMAVKSVRSRLASSRLRLGFDVDAPDLAAFNSDPTRMNFSGSLSGTGEILRANGETNGHGRLNGRDLRFQEFTANRLELEVPIEHDSARAARFELDINGKDRLTGEASVKLRPPFAYEGRISGNIRDAGIFQPFIGAPIAGALDLDWHGSGEIATLRHSGEGQLAITRGQFAQFKQIDGEASGRYSPDFVELDAFHFQSDQGAVQAGVHLRDRRLNVEKLRLEIGKTAMVTGSLSLAADLRTLNRPETIFPANGALQGALALESLDLAKIVPSVPAKEAQKGKRTALSPEPDASKSVRKLNSPKAAAKTVAGQPQPSAQGQITGSLTAAGTLGAPELSLVLRGNNLRAAAAPGFPAASGVLSAVVQGDRLFLNGALNQPGIKPLQVTVAMPLSIRKVISERRVDPETPLSAALQIPESPVTLLAVAFPQMRLVEGHVAVNASCGGTLAHPLLAGGVVFNLPAIRFQNAEAPGIENLRGDLRFSGNELVIRKFEGDVAGGPFAVSGRANLEKLTDPLLDLRFRSQGTLLVRNDSLTLRTDSDLRINGPFNSAQVTGSVGIVNSRFYRDIEILPIGLPGRPAPKTSTATTYPSIEMAPFRGWNFDVVVKTKEPFVIRGNMANGVAHADFRLGGNGLLPTLEGSARIENFEASLPFSRLTIDYGYLYYSADNPFNPTLDIHGTSRIRDYNIGVWIYGTASEPQTLFSSEPPLAQEEVIALLATGATSKEITQSNQAMAGRAGMLLLQDLYLKVFKRRKPPGDSKPDQPLNRLALDLGTVDPRTGRQEIGGHFKLSDQYEIGAGVDIQGDVRVQLQYLLRFR